MPSRWPGRARAVIVTITVVGLVVLGASWAGAERRTQSGGFQAEQQTLEQAAGPNAALVLDQARMLEAQLGIPESSGEFTAANIGSGLAQTQKSLSDIAKLITAGSYVAGLGFAVAAIAKFKAHKDNPTQEHISQPIVFLFVAAALIFLPGIFKSAGGTLYDGATQAEVAAGVDNLFAAVTPVVSEAARDGLTKPGDHGALLPAKAEERIRSTLQARGLTGQGLEAMTTLASLTVGAIVAGARV